MRLGTTVRVAGAAAAVVGLAAIGLATMAQAQAPAPLRIGVMEGFSGVYGDLTLGGRAGLGPSRALAGERAGQPLRGRGPRHAPRFAPAGQSTQMIVGADAAGVSGDGVVAAARDWIRWNT